MRAVRGASNQGGLPSRTEGKWQSQKTRIIWRNRFPFSLATTMQLRQGDFVIGHPCAMMAADRKIAGVGFCRIQALRIYP
jgi:hypothetical protein